VDDVQRVVQHRRGHHQTLSKSKSKLYYFILLKFVLLSIRKVRSTVVDIKVFFNDVT
jgi:hypothetical protein